MLLLPGAASIAGVLQAEYGLKDVRVDSAPQGADRDSTLFRAQDAGGRDWIVRLRRGPVKRASLLLPQLLRARGEPALLAPQPTRSGDLWLGAGAWHLALYPFVAGRNGFECPLNAAAWHQLGRALRALHETRLPAELLREIPRETCGAESGAALQQILAQSAAASEDPLVAQLRDLLQRKRAALDWLVEQTTSLARTLRKRGLPCVPCHADIHAGNVLVDAQGRLHLLDRDTLLLAPRERDLMFIGAGVAGHWREAQEAAWFYEAYGSQQPDPQALAYYRCERVVADVVDYCEQLSGADSDQGRPAALAELQRQLAPGPELQIARNTVAALSSA